MSALSKLNLGSSRPSTLVGLDIQPGDVAAVQARVNGSIVTQRAAGARFPGDTVREGDVHNLEVRADVLKDLFEHSQLDRRVRIGVANQRAVLRMLELPPVTDRKELAAAVRFQAQDQVPMPLSNAVLDFHPLGIFDSPGGPRQRVVLVAAQRDMVERLLDAVRAAGLTPEGVDLSAFALIRSLHDRADGEHARVLYVNVDGLTNLAIAEGTTCRFTRVVGGGVEAMAADLAVRRGVALPEARALLASIDLSIPSMPETVAAQPPAAHDSEELHSGSEQAQTPGGQRDGEASDADHATDELDSTLSRDEHEAREVAMGYRETIEAAQPPAPAQEPAAPAQISDADIRDVLETGVREIAGEIRNSLDFHRTQDQGGEVAHVALSGAALDLPGFADALQTTLGMEVRSEAVGLVDGELAGKVSTHRLSI